MKVSASLIRSFMKCGQQAKFNYVDKVPQLQNSAASFGTAVHLAIELYNNNHDVDAAVNLFLFAWDNPDEFGITPEIWLPRTSFSAYRERGVKFIREYDERWRWTDRHVIATEHRFMVDLGEHQISGMVDILETVGDVKQLRVVDLKTGYRPNKTNLGYDVQFSSYLYAAQQKEFWCGHPLEPDKYSGFPNGEELYEQYRDYEFVGIWSDLKNNKDYPVGPRTQADYDKLEMCINEIAKAVKFDVFIPDISGDTCGICSYTEICPIYSPPENEYA